MVKTISSSLIIQSDEKNYEYNLERSVDYITIIIENEKVNPPSEEQIKNFMTTIRIFLSRVSNCSNFITRCKRIR